VEKTDFTIRPRIFSEHRELKFAFSTRRGGVSPEPLGLNLGFVPADSQINVLENRSRFFGALRIDIADLAIPIQNHTGSVRRVYHAGGYLNTDALVTDTIGIFLVVTVADCVPIFLFDPVHHAIAAIHAGWRGTVQRIAEKTVRMMKTEFSTAPEDLLAYLGPSAGVCCYSVGNEVASQFEPHFVFTDDQGKPHVDLKGANSSQLLNAGLIDAHLEVSSHCTIHESELFHSYRRDGEKSGRMMGVIGLVR